MQLFSRDKNGWQHRSRVRTPKEDNIMQHGGHPASHAVLDYSIYL